MTISRKNMIKNMIKKYIAFVLFAIMILNTDNVYAASIIEDSTVSLMNLKITPDLQKIMNQAEDDELIPIWLWIESIDDALVDQLMIKETGMDPAIYENGDAFNSKRLPEIEKEVEKELGYEKAHSIISLEPMDDASNMIFTDIVIEEQTGRTPIDEAVLEEIDDFIIQKRGIQKREQSAYNQEFIDEHIKQFGNREILYMSKFSSVLAIKATKDEINYYTQLNTVEKITYFTEVEAEPALDIVTEQVGVYTEGGTGYDGYNWVAQDGYGVKIGVMEVREKYVSDAEQIKNNNKIFFLENIREDGTTAVAPEGWHSTAVVSIISGKTVRYNSYTYKGIAPEATIYQMSVDSTLDEIRCIEKFAELGVHVVNYSGGENKSSLSYTDNDQLFDKIINDSGMVFVAAAGNPIINVASPAICFNAITVGAVTTKRGPFESVLEPYVVRPTSAYLEADYLPNKPDIVAPGTEVCIVSDFETEYPEDIILQSNGTSFAAPIITGIIAQMMSENYSLRTNPLAVKAALLLGADHSRLDITNDTAKGNGLRDKTGTGFIDARYALGRISPSSKINLDLNDTTESGEYYFEAGTRVKVVMVFDKTNDVLIEEQSDLDDLDLILRKADTGNNCAMSQSRVNNVEIIDYTITQSGYYYFDVYDYRIVDAENKPSVAIAFRVYD